MKKTVLFILIYVSGVAINLLLINSCYKVNFAYPDGLPKEFIQSLSFVSYAATPAVIFVCWDSNRE